MRPRLEARGSLTENRLTASFNEGLDASEQSMSSFDSATQAHLVLSRSPWQGIPRAVQCAHEGVSLGLLFFISLVAGCGETTCPMGSTEVDGKCQMASAVEQSDGGLDAGEDAPVATDAGDADTGADAADLPEPDSCGLEAACTPGSENVACDTECGTQGSGTCTELCNPAPPDQCVPPVEACNWVDDDCDGVADPGMLTQLTSGSRVFTAENGGTLNAVEPFLLPRAGGGAWLLHSTSPVGLYGDGHSIHAAELNEDGTSVRGMRVLSASARTLRFNAASDGKWVTVLALQRETKTNDSLIIKLLLYKASDLSFVSEYTLESLLDGDGQRNERDDNDDCPFAALGDVRVREDAAGTVRVMLAYGTAPGGLQSIGGGYFVCNTTAPYSSRITAMAYAAGAWNAPKTVVNTPAVQQYFGDLLRVEPLPCRSEWLAIYANKVENFTTPEGKVAWTISRVSEQGEVLETNLDSLDSVGALFDLEHAGMTDCSADPVLHLAYGSPSLYEAGVVSDKARAHLRRWSVDRETGALARIAGDLNISDAGAIRAKVLTAQGRLFVSITRFSQGSGGNDIFKGNIGLLEIPQQGFASRDISTTLLGDGSAFGTDLAFTGSAIVLATSVLQPDSLNSARESGDTYPAVGATYRFGCQ